MQRSVVSQVNNIYSRVLACFPSSSSVRAGRKGGTHVHVALWPVAAHAGHTMVHVTVIHVGVIHLVTV